MNELGKMLVVLGFLLALVGTVLWTGVGRTWLGRLPGDIHFRSGNVNFYFPLVTCLLLSLLFTLVMWILKK